ncbi:MAG TPA: PhoH family protein [Candidatus Eisenbergiella stercorigallinarum]|uniref:PhoH family protein n=2 Tax=Eisenbergiella TaxID=1432051 RepID=A0A9D2QXP6_9FIRM|nr:PhoH family protein [Candidatus Eisenbergiella pullistercoris]HJD31590.1 PhoH family protein [Candidatus Eisenbergiella stercorigallinarum]
MQKTYILDTNVLIQAPYALQSFEDNHLVLPLAVLEELDGLKNAEGERGANARQAIRYLESLRTAGNLLEGVSLPGGGTLRLEVNCVDVKLPEGFPEHKNDNRILKVCIGLRNRETPVILVTKDIMVRVKAQMLGISAEDFTTEQAPVSEEQYTGRCEVFVAEKKFEDFKKKHIAPEDVYQAGESGEKLPVTLVPNQFVILREDQSARKTQLGRFDGKKIVPLAFQKKKPYGVSPRNVGQKFLQEALMADAEKAPLVIVKGMAGTAKTFYTLAVGLHTILEQDEPAYRRILISRPNAQFDDDIGFLPGDESEKIAPLLRPVIDNLELLVDQNEEERFVDERSLSGKVEELFDRGIVDAQALNFIRGRSISKTYLVIDEAQNLTPKQAKGIITRAGMGTKIILLGDPQQIDHPLLDERTNGLSYAAEKMKGSPLCWQVTMSAEECERSALALDAVKRM